MTWHTATSFIAAVVVYYLTWQIETYVGWCGTPAAGWKVNATVIGAIGSAIAILPLINAWRAPGLTAAVSRVVHLTLLVGFACFLVRNYVWPY